MGNRQYKLGLIQSMPQTTSQTDVIIPVAVSITLLLITVFVVGLMVWAMRRKRKKAVTVVELTDEGFVAYHRTISATGSASASQFAGETSPQITSPMSSNNSEFESISSIFSACLFAQ